MDLGDIKFIRPKNEKLQPLIKGYYIHKSDDPDFHAKITFYQNITTTISNYKNSATSSTGRHRVQRFKENNGYSSLLAGLVDKYQEVEFIGLLDRLAIVFYPLGINHFIDVPLSSLLEKHYSYFDYYGEDFITFLDLVYREPQLESKRNLLDDFFLQQYKPFKEIILKQAVDLLLGSEEQLKVEDLAKRLGVNRRTLLRKFKHHTGYSIEEYKLTIRFRKALLHFQENQKDFQLTEIAHHSNYYDQANFNHNIKERSELTPSELFKQINIMDDVLFWKI